MTAKTAPITKTDGRNGLVLFVLTAALTAAGGLVVEIVAGRILAPFLGMSLYTWTAVIAVVLAGFSAGHWIGGRLADRPPMEARRAVAWTLLLAALSTLASLMFLRIASGPILSLGLPPVATIIALTAAPFSFSAMLATGCRPSQCH
jgi:predicted membrane-bound spermidine synthase